MRNPGANKVLLIVDDSPVIRTSLKSYFSEFNFEIITCSDGLEGIKKAVENTPDLIFLDILMPNLDGLKMLQVIKVIDNVKQIPVIVISGNASRTNVISAIEAGADSVISKPIVRENLFKKIDELLGPAFLESGRVVQTEEAKQNKELKDQLLKFFLDNFSKNKLTLMNALEKKDKKSVGDLVHDIKGSGGTIGYPLLSIISYEIENAVRNPDPDWQFITKKCQQIFTIVDKIDYH